MKSRHPRKHHPKLIFPLSMHLKVIMDNSFPVHENRHALEAVFIKLEIPHKDWSDKTSGEKKFIGFTVEVTLSSRKLMYAMYEALKTVPGLRMAL
jgi:hypothetical protein